MPPRLLTAGANDIGFPTINRMPAPHASPMRKCSIKFIGTNCCGGFPKQARDVLALLGTKQRGGFLKRARDLMAYWRIGSQQLAEINTERR